MKSAIYLSLSQFLHITRLSMGMFFALGASAQSYEDTLLYIPTGTLIVIETAEPLSTERGYFGKSFDAVLTDPIVVKGRTLIPAGGEVRGVIGAMDRAKNLGGRAYLGLELEKLGYDDVWLPIQTDRIGFTGEGSDTGLKTGVGAGVGAVVGGFKWAVRGALVGLGVSALTPGKQIEIPRGTVLEFFLEEDLLLVSERL